MLRLRFLIVLLPAICFFVSCDSVVIESDIGPAINDSTEISDPALDTEKFSVADAMALSDGERACVGGYIVGCVKGTQIGGALFVGPFDGIASNLLIADSPAERMPYNCMPVELKIRSDIRECLNLSSHPEMLGQYVMIIGSVKTYFGRPGLKNVLNFRIPDDHDASSDTIVNIVFPIG